MRKRLPRKIRLGPYIIDIVLANQTTIRDVLDDDDGNDSYHGCWDNLLGESTSTVCGRIYIHEKESMTLKWETLWHEIAHALVDIASWDHETAPVQ